MEFINSVFSWIIKKRMHQIELFKKYPIDVQNDMFRKLLNKAKHTEFGKKYDFSNIDSHQRFINQVPLQDYESLKPYIIRIKHGEQNLLWPTEIKWFAKSSGTVNDKSKFIPVSKESLVDCHYKGGKDLLSIYHTNNPNSKLITGKTLIVGGSSEVNHFSSDSYYGDLSAIIIDNLPYWVESRRTPNKKIALINEWEKKIEQMAITTSNENVTNISGVPSWTLLLLNRILELNNVKHITEIWPNIELYMHGGVSFEPYINQFKAIIPSKNMNYVESYNASEGYFGIQDTKDSSELLLMLDYGVFYEFIPFENIHDENPKILQLQDIEIGKKYELVISTNGGLWRYRIGDVIRFTNLKPFRFKIAGRTKLFINLFGEELVIENTDKAISIAAKKTNCLVKEYTVAPKLEKEGASGVHEWVIEFEKEPDDISYFTEILDNALKSLNSDYEAKRYKNMILQKPIINIVKPNTFYAWLKDKQKLGGQNKVPRLSNNRDHIDQIMQYNNSFLK